MTRAALALLAKLWDAGLLTHHLTTSGPFLTLNDTLHSTRITLTAEESSLFYLCTDHGGVLEAGDERCQTHRNQVLLDIIKNPHQSEHRIIESLSPSDVAEEKAT